MVSSRSFVKISTQSTTPHENPERSGLRTTSPLLAEKRPSLKRIGGEGRISDCGAESGAPLIKAPPVWGGNFFAFAPTKPRALCLYRRLHKRMRIGDPGR